MSASYFKAAIPEPHRILGQRLLPFSLGHYMILSRFESPFVADNPPEHITREDVVFAVLVCSHAHDDFFGFIESENVTAHMTKWGEAVGLFDVSAKAMAFWRYYLEGTRWPKYWEESAGSNKPTGTHWSQAMLVELTSHVGYTRSQALDSPFTQSVSDYMRYCETQGAVRLMTDCELEMIAQAEKEAAASGPRP